MSVTLAPAGMKIHAKPFQSAYHLLSGASKLIVYTIGYDRRSFDEFAKILRRYGVLRVVDVRRWARSVRTLEYSAEHLSRALQSLGVEYYWIPELGGYRRFGVYVDDLGIATCFESPGFRAYTTYIAASTPPSPTWTGWSSWCPRRRAQ